MEGILCWFVGILYIMLSSFYSFFFVNIIPSFPLSLIITISFSFHYTAPMFCIIITYRNVASVGLICSLCRFFFFPPSDLTPLPAVGRIPSKPGGTEGSNEVRVR